MNYGKELILDLHECDPSKFTRESLDKYFYELCELIDMEKCERFWWDDLETPEDEKETEPHLIGTSAVQFIKTSNITIHTLDILKCAYINIFSCKEFDQNTAENYSSKFFNGKIKKSTIVERV